MKDVMEDAMLKMFYPDEIADSAYKIDYKTLYKNGYRGLIFDIDNTLVEHGADANEKAIKLIHQLKEIGFKICLMSNNKEERVLRFNKDINVFYIFDAKKPSIINYQKAMKLLGTNKKNTVFVGDQLFTDVFGQHYKSNISKYGDYSRRRWFAGQMSSNLRRVCPQG